jgi:hypothetical protein
LACLQITYLEYIDCSNTRATSCQPAASPLNLQHFSFASSLKREMRDQYAGVRHSLQEVPQSSAPNLRTISSNVWDQSIPGYWRLGTVLICHLKFIYRASWAVKTSDWPALRNGGFFRSHPSNPSFCRSSSLSDGPCTACCISGVTRSQNRKSVDVRFSLLHRPRR